MSQGKLPRSGAMPAPPQTTYAVGPKGVPMPPVAQEHAEGAAGIASPENRLPEKDARKLIESCQGLVKSLAWKIHRKVPPSVELDDLVAYGQVGLAQAARDFDPTRGGQFTTYAYYRIRGAILDGLSQMSWFSRHDYHACRYERMANEVMHAEAEEGSRTGQVDVSGEVHWMARVSGALGVAYLTSGLEAKDQQVGDAMVDSQEPSALAGDREILAKLVHLVDNLPREARELIRAAYFEGTTLEEAGRRVGISKAWASRLHAKTLVRLGHALKLLGASDEQR
jgi:RNA polymerase sigma factor for flagellar operon FliA